MPIYELECSPCKVRWDVAKSMASYDDPEPCPTCGKPGFRLVSRTNFNGASDWNTQSWSPALGCYTRNTRHARQIAKSKGMEEVGTEPPEKIHAKFDKDREETRARRWAEADRDKVYE